jgi:hypothetical protein
MPARRYLFSLLEARLTRSLIVARLDAIAVLKAGGASARLAKKASAALAVAALTA